MDARNDPPSPEPPDPDLPEAGLAGLLRKPLPAGSEAGDLVEMVYGELRSVAAALLKAERADHTLQPTALVHEAYLRLVDQSRADWQGSAHFRAIAARAMRRVLVDHARRHGAAKRGGGRQRVTLADVADPAGRDVELLDLEQALIRLAAENERAARVVELKFFAGLTGEEIGHVLGVSVRTVKADWSVAKLWLSRELRRTGEEPE